MQSLKWHDDNQEFVSHFHLAKYIEEVANREKVLEDIRFSTRVKRLVKQGDAWLLEASNLVGCRGSYELKTTLEVSLEVVFVSMPG